MDVLAAMRPATLDTGSRPKATADVKPVTGESPFAALLAGTDFAVAEPVIGEGNSIPAIVHKETVTEAAEYQTAQEQGKNNSTEPPAEILYAKAGEQMPSVLGYHREQTTLTREKKSLRNTVQEQKDNLKQSLLTGKTADSREKMQPETQNHIFSKNNIQQQNGQKLAKAGHPLSDELAYTLPHSSQRQPQIAGNPLFVAGALQQLRTSLTPVGRETGKIRTGKQVTERSRENSELLNVNSRSKVMRPLPRNIERAATAASLPETRQDIPVNTTIVSRETILIREFLGQNDFRHTTTSISEPGAKQSQRTDRSDLPIDRFLRTENNKVTRNMKAEPPTYLSRQFDEIIQRARLQVRENGTANLTTRLFPREMGAVTVNLTLTEGIISARFTVANETVQRELSAHIENIREQLQQDGIRLANFSVNIGGQALQQQQESSEDKQLIGTILPKAGDAYEQTEIRDIPKREGLYA